MSATWRRRRPVGLTRDGVPSNTAFFPRDAQDLAMSQVLSQCAWSDVCMHVAECVVRCMYACAWSDVCMHVRGPMYVCMSQVLSQRVFSQSVSRECFQGVFSESVFILSSSFFPWWCGFQLPLDGLCLSMAFASRWPLPLDGFSMAFRWPLDGLSMAYRWGVSPPLPLPRPLWRREAGVGRRISRARARGAVAARRARVAHRNCPGLYLHPHSEALDPKP